MLHARIKIQGTPLSCSNPYTKYKREIAQKQAIGKREPLYHSIFSPFPSIFQRWFTNRPSKQKQLMVKMGSEERGSHSDGD
jgi:tRNA U54 and U55 pseudouridine synthase Pus10